MRTEQLNYVTLYDVASFEVCMADAQILTIIDLVCGIPQPNAAQCILAFLSSGPFWQIFIA